MRNCLIEMRIPSTETSSHSLEVSDIYLWMVVVMILSSFLGVNLYTVHLDLVKYEGYELPHCAAT